MRVEGAAFVLGALALLTLPLNWLLAAFAAAVVHELCHALAVLGCGGSVWSLTLGAGGARMETSPLSRRQELLCALAGPAGSLALLALGRWLPRVAVCGFFQGAFNLLPLFPLDGGRALRCAVPKWSGVIETVFSLAAALGAVIGAIRWQWGAFPLVFLALVLGKGKKPCKSRRFRVQ